MSRYDYEASQRISREDWPFYALIMAAMRQADTDNLEGLKLVFPMVWKELYERYNAPGGILPSDTQKGG